MTMKPEDFRTLLESIDGKVSFEDTYKEVTEENIVGDVHTLNEAASDLEEIYEQMIDLIYRVDDVLSSIRSDPDGDMIYRRAESYWVPHIKGALGGEFSSGSMVTMEDTINELRGAESNADDGY